MAHPYPPAAFDAAANLANLLNSWELPIGKVGIWGGNMFFSYKNPIDSS